MPRKKKRAMVPASPPRFTEGTPVRVKAGVADPDYPDIPLGGWTGTVNDIDTSARPPMVEVEWSHATLSRIHPIYERRCERDGLDYDSTWLRETDLENDPGGEPAIEQPTQLRPRPLNHEDPSDICRGVFSLTSDDDPPAVSEETLRRYHEHLTARLRLPCPAIYLVSKRFRGSTVTPAVLLRLAPVEEATIGEGLMAEVTLDGRLATVPLADLHLPPPGRSYQEMTAYQIWFSEAPEAPLPSESPRTAILSLLLFILGMGMVGGALLETIPDARLAVQIGGTLVALLGAVVGAYFEMGYRRDRRMSPGMVGGAFFGLVFGGAVGAVAGCVVLAYVGAIPGAIAGTVLARILAALKRRGAGTFLPTLAGAVLGAMGYAFYLDAASAAPGAMYGALVALAGGVVFFIGMFVYSLVSFRSQDE